MTKSGVVGLLLAGGIASLVGGFAASEEAGPYFNRAAPGAGVMAAITAGRLGPALSQPAAQAVVTDCLETARSLYFKFRPGDEQQAFAQKCREIVAGMVTEMPSFSFGWAAMAHLDAVIGDTESLNRDLVTSQATGRTEQWIAELRVEIAEDNFSRLSSEAIAAEALDLGLLVVSPRGIERIAQRYVDDASFRERITAVVETLPQEAQSRFVMLVRRAAQI